jgi:beta-lactamase class A
MARTHTTVSLAAVIALLNVGLVAQPAAHAASARPSGELVCPGLGSVPITLQGDPARGGKVLSADPAVRLLKGPGVAAPPVRQPSTATVAPTLSCTGPGGGGYVVESMAGSLAPPADAAQEPSAAARAQAAATVTFPFQAELAAYLAGRPGSVTVAAQGLGGPVMGYTKGEATNVTASIVKVQVMATVMRRAQEQGRGLTAWEKSKVVPMIRTSDNAATSALWSYVGGGREVARVDRLLGLTSTSVSMTGSWGLTVTSAPDNVILMNRFAYPNTVLSNSSRAYGLSLMDSITPSQDWGVSAGPPAGSVQLKNGWLPRTDGWHVNSIGFSSSGATPYSIAILTHSTSGSMATQVATIEGASRIIWRHAASLATIRGDWDQTRTADLLGTSEGGELVLYPGSGTGTLGARTTFGSGWGAMTWMGSPGDVDRDGKTDLLAVDGAGLLYLYRGAGPAAFHSPVQVGKGWDTISAIATAPDFDGNGTPDLLARYADGSLGQYSIGSTGLISKVRVFGNGWQIMRTILGCRDFTGDGRADLLGVGIDGSLRAYASTGTSLRTIGVVGSGWQTISQVAVPGDLTGDGLDDVMALTPTNELRVYVGRAGGTLGSKIDTGASGAGVTRIL